MAKVKETAFAVIYFLIGLILTRVIWYAVEPLISMFEGNSFVLAIAWGGLLLAWILLIPFPAIYSLINGTIPNLYYVGKSALSVFIGLIIVRISWFIVPIVLQLLGNNNPTESSIMWFFLIIMWITTLIVIPAHFANEAISH
jgi:hypothetical protein